MSFLRNIKFLLEYIPEIPFKQQSFQDRLSMTITVMILYLVMFNFPIYGIKAGTIVANPFFHQRIPLAASNGTLMELGVSHILTSGIVMQILTSAKVLTVNNSLKEERALLQGFQKLVAILIVIFQSVTFVLAGFYGSVSFVKAVLIIFQLISSGLIVIYFDELLQKGYGLGSGISLFTCSAVTLDLMWKFIGISTVPVISDASIASNSTQFVGALLALPHALVTRDDRLWAAFDITFGRTHSQNLSSLSGVGISIALALAIVHFLMWRVEVVVTSAKQRSAQGKLPVKLLYTSNVPLAIYSVLAGNIFMFSQIIFFAFPSSFLTKITGRWELPFPGGILAPVDGLPYYLSFPTSLRDIFLDPFHAMFYLVLILSFVATVAKIWIEISGTNARGIAKDLREKDMIIKGHRGSNLEHELNRNIPTAAAFGGMVIGGLAVVADMLGSAVSGAGIAICVTAMFQYYEIAIREGGPMISTLLGEAGN